MLDSIGASISGWSYEGAFILYDTCVSFMLTLCLSVLSADNIL